MHFKWSLARVMTASLLAIAGITAGCGGRSPAGPSQQGPQAPGVVPLGIYRVTPTTGQTSGATQVTITGNGFESGAAVTFDGIAADARVVSNTVITAATPAHTAATVRVAVTNPDGQSGGLNSAYTFTDLVISTVSPVTGSTGGSTSVTITGAGFEPGAIVTFGGLAASAYVVSSTAIYTSTPAHASGPVDVAVSNRSDWRGALAGSYTYVPQEVFDFNGEWAGAAGPEYEIGLRFTIRNDTLVSISCHDGPPVSLSPPPVVSHGEFSFSGDDGVGVSGRIVAAAQAVGKINLAPCSATIWIASKK